MNDLRRIDYADTFSINCPVGTTARDILLGFFSATPLAVRILMAIRNWFVSLFGLKATRTISPPDASLLQSGQRIGLFEISSLTPTSAILGADDAHLNFRVLLNVAGALVSCTTQVQFNNAAGRIYFLFVKPFHRLIVPAMLKACVKKLNQKSQKPSHDAAK
jgi:hypothetical protein